MKPRRKCPRGGKHSLLAGVRLIRRHYRKIWFCLKCGKSWSRW